MRHSGMASTCANNEFEQTFLALWSRLGETSLENAAQLNRSVERGDFIVLTFNPQSGHEQKGHRLALVISNTLFNKRTGSAIVCPKK